MTDGAFTGSLAPTKSAGKFRRWLSVALVGAVAAYLARRPTWLARLTEPSAPADEVRHSDDDPRGANRFAEIPRQLSAWQ